jgi:hypothetical protein
VFYQWEDNKMGEDTEVRTLLFLPTSGARVCKSVQTTGEDNKMAERQSNNWIRILDEGSGGFIAFGVTI